MAGRMREHFPLKSDNSGELICAAERSRGNQIITVFFLFYFFVQGPHPRGTYLMMCCAACRKR